MPTSPTSRPIRRALISVSDKTGVVPFARALVAQGVALISTGNSARTIAEAELPVTEVANVTGVPEMLDGRVKTLHPAIHGGLLARRDRPDHLAILAEHGIGEIDLLVSNLYPFAATVASGAGREDCVENIDIGGPALIRAAAKNHEFVTVVTDPADYDVVLGEMTAAGWWTPHVFWIYYLGILLYWLHDMSPGKQQTLAFLDRSLKIGVTVLRQ